MKFKKWWYKIRKWCFN